MKNAQWILAGMFSFIVFTLLLSKGEGEQNVVLDNMLGIETVAYGEDLPGVVITCGSPEIKDVVGMASVKLHGHHLDGIKLGIVAGQQVIKMIFVVMVFHVEEIEVLLFIPLLFVATACCDRGAEMAKYTIHFDLRKAVKMNLPEFVDSIFVIPLATNDSSLIKNVVGLSFVDSIFYINDNQTNILSFDSKGNFLCSTGKLRGSGPNEYFACIAFNILENGNCEIFDGLKHRLWEYDSNLNYVASSELPEDVLPASNFLRVSKDICIIEDVNSLKFYSSKEGRVLKMISLPQKKGLPSITRNSGLKKLNDEIYYSLRTPERILFKVDIEKMSLQPYYAFDFGQHNLNLRELPNELPLSFYQNYVMANDGVAFVADNWFPLLCKCVFYL